MLEVLIAVAFLAMVGERLSEVIIVPGLDLISWPSEKKRVWCYRVVCAIPGFLLTLVSGLDGFTEVGITFPIWPLTGSVVTAIAAGFGSNFVNEIFTSVRSSRGGTGSP